MKKLIFIIITFFCFSDIQSQVHKDWINYSPFLYATDVVVDGDVVWLSAHNGIMKYEKSTGKITYLNRANSNLADNNVLSLHMDSSKNMWYGCEFYGVGKITDTGGQIFTSENSGLPTEKYIFKIKEDIDGNIWIVSDNYISRFDGVNWKTWTVGFPANVYSMPVVDFAFDSANVAYVISTDGLGQIKNDIYSIIPGIYPAFDQCIAIDDSNIVWVGVSGKGLYEYNGDTIIHYTLQNSDLQNEDISDIEFHEESGLWIATNGGLVNFHEDKFRYYKTNGPGPTSLSIDDDGSIWCGTGGDQLLHFKDSIFTYIDLETNSQISRSNRVLLIDTNDTKWITDFGRLVVKTDSGFNFIADNMPYVVIEDHDGAIWVAFLIGDIHMQKMTEFDTIVFDTTNSPLIAIIPEGSSSLVKRRLISDMVADQNNHIWISTGDNGLYEYDGTQFLNYCTENSGVPSNRLGKLLVDRDNNIWGASASKGLFKFDGETWTNWNTENSTIPGNEVLSLSFDTDSLLWISFRGGGLSSFNGLEFTTFDTTNSDFLSNTVTEILAGEDSVWLATSGAGLVVFDKNSVWKSYNVSNSGIASNHCSSIKRDKEGFLWIGHSNAGISVYKGASIIDHFENFVGDHHDLLIYPNPTRETIYIRTPNGEQVEQVRIFDMSGRLLASVAVNQVQNDRALYQLQLGDLDASGFLILQIKTTSGRTISERFYYSK